MSGLSLVVGANYVSKKRPQVVVQLEGAEGEGRDGLVAILFLKSGERLRTPMWLFEHSYRRDTSNALKREAVLR